VKPLLEFLIDSIKGLSLAFFLFPWYSSIMNIPNFCKARGNWRSWISRSWSFSMVTYLKCWAIFTSLRSMIYPPTLIIAYCISLARWIPFYKIWVFLGSRESKAIQKLSFKQVFKFSRFLSYRIYSCIMAIYLFLEFTFSLSLSSCCLLWDSV